MELGLELERDRGIVEGRGIEVLELEVKGEIVVGSESDEKK